MALTKSMPGFSYDPSKGKFRSYLKTIVLHVIYRKSCQNQGAVALGNLEALTAAGAADQTIEIQWEAEWRQYHLRMAMKIIATEFNKTDLAAFERYVLAGEEARLVADAIGLTIDQVYQAKSRILRRLGELIEQQVQDEG